jgi:TRAP-type C4-dicarboxylate transport system substrate-binding protein
MKKHNYFLILLAIVCFFSFAITANAKDVSLTLKYSHGNNEFDATQLQGEIFKKLLEDRSSGKLKVDIFPGTLTTSGKESMEFLIAGTVDVGPVPAGHIAGFQKDVQFLAMPYLFNSQEHYNAAKNCGAVKEILKELEKATNLIAAGFVTDTNGLAFATTKPINSMADAKGIKLRSMTNPLFVDMYSAFGFNVTPTDWSEVYTSLQTGVVEGDDLGVKANYDFKFNEVVKAFAITKHCWTKQVTLVSPKLMKKVSETQGEMIINAIRDAIAVADMYQYVREAEYIDKAKKDGYTVTYPDIKPFKEASKGVYEKWFKKYPHWRKWYDEIQFLDPGVIKTKAESKL